MGATLCWYIKVKVSKLCHDNPHLTMGLYSEFKTQDKISWDNMMQVRISKWWKNGNQTI